MKFDKYMIFNSPYGNIVYVFFLFVAFGLLLIMEKSNIHQQINNFEAVLDLVSFPCSLMKD